MANISKVISSFEKFAPKEFALDWDNVGLICGDTESECTGVVLTLDITSKTLAICRETGANLCISHHPLIFDPIRRINDSIPNQKLFHELIKSNISVYAAHTNLDGCRGGVTETLAFRIGIRAEMLPGALRVEEMDQYSEKGAGQYCRIGNPINEDLTLFSLYGDINRQLRIKGSHVNFDDDRKVSRVLLCGGSLNSEWIEENIYCGADTFICGEMKHHDMLMLAELGIAAFAVGHDASERVVLPVVRDFMRSLHPEILFAVDGGLDYNKIVF